MNASQTISGLLVPQPSTVPHRHLFGRVWDFWLLGGGSLIALLGLYLAFDEKGRGFSIAMTLFLANFINHPHFAHSYQMFYRDFGNKLTRYPKALRIRYFVSGIVIPVVLITFFALTVVSESVRLLGIAANLMFFLVGWHYVKQGYGMAMVDAVLKRAFYTEQEKKGLLQNAYAVWLFSWLLVNYLAGSKQGSYFDIPYFVIPVSVMVLTLSGVVCAWTSLRVIYLLWKRQGAKQSIAWNGLLAYGVSLYAWLLVRDPFMLLWIPLFHSLQYMAVVWRYEINRSKGQSSSARPALRFALFSIIGFGLGYLGFWFLPEWLNANISYSKELFGSYLFMYVFWIFINVHHYTLDAVMWRKGNPDVQAHLFTH